MSQKSIEVEKEYPIETHVFVRPFLLRHQQGSTENQQEQGEEDCGYLAERP